MLLHVSQHQVLNDVILSVQNNIPELSEVLDYVLSFKVTIDRDQVVSSELEV